MLKNSLMRRPRANIILLVSVIMGSAVATAFLGLGGDLGHRIALEMRNYGANILVEPLAGERGGYLNEAELPRIKGVFWRYNITGLAPYLFSRAEFSSGSRREQGVLTGTWFSRPMLTEGEGESVQGVKVIAPWWGVSGRWPEAADEAIVGASLARRLGVAPGGEILASVGGERQLFRVAGVVTTGGFEEEQLFAPLVTVQSLTSREGRVSRVLVSALTVPMDDFGRRDPAGMSRDEYEKWYCTAYVTSVAKNVEEVMSGSRARPIWQIASAEGELLTKLNSLMLLLALLALAAAATAVSTSQMASTAQRAQEIALMKAIGADRRQISAILLGEVLLIASAGAIVGYLLGDRLAEFVSRVVFNSTLKSTIWLLPIAIISALAVAVAGSMVPLRRALGIEPVRALKG